MDNFRAALDIYAAANTYPHEGRVLAHITQRAAIKYAITGEGRTNLKVLLAFADALAYTDHETLAALQSAMSAS